MGRRLLNASFSLENQGKPTPTAFPGSNLMLNSGGAPQKGLEQNVVISPWHLCPRTKQSRMRDSQ